MADLIYTNKQGNKLKIGYGQGKMLHIPHLSTSPELNKLCLARIRNKDSACYYCFSFATVKMYKQTRNMLIENTKVLTTELIPDIKINTILFRFESFGDIINEIQFENYIRISRANKRTNFALWTKHITSVERMLDKFGKPDNLQLIYSSPMLNKQTNINKFKYVDKVFTVYSKEYAKDSNININCGSRACFNCSLCYQSNNVRYINELLKKRGIASNNRKGTKHVHHSK